MGSYQPISRVAVIGAGPVGVAFAKYLRAERVFETIEVFEQRDRVGGIWNLSTPEKTRRIPVPQTNPRYGQTKTRELLSSIDNGDDEKEQGGSESLEFESPLYDYLETNIPKTMMAFSDKPFPDDAPLYPSHEQVLEYLEEYAEDVKPLIRFRCQVQDVRLEASSSVDQPVWCVEVRDLVSNSTSSSKFDAVVVANGHYTVPSLPHIEGIEQWNAEYCGSILHSKAYRKPEEFKGKKVLVIGNSASGLDVAYQVSQECDQPVLLSSRSVSAFGTMPGSSWRKDIGEVVEFLPVSEHSRAVRLRDGSVESDIDAVIFCTGYFYSYPFLSSHDLPLIGDGLRVQGTFEHLFHSIHPSLVFPVINLKVIPFPLAEHQAAVVARVWSGRLSLPSTGKMHAWEESVVEQKGSGKYFHLKKFPEDAAQINNLFRWAKSAAKVPGLVNGGQGRLGKPWGKEEVWLRSKFSELKAAYLHRGEARMRVRTVKELGFDFDEWTRTAMPDDLKMFLEAQVLDEDAA